MKITIQNKEIYEILPVQESLLKSTIPSEIYEADIARRLQYSIEYPIKGKIRAHKKKILDQLQRLGVEAAPSRIEDLIEFIAPRNDLNFKDLRENIDYSVAFDGREIFKISKSYRRMMISYMSEPEIEFYKNAVIWVMKEKMNHSLDVMHKEWDPRLSAKSLLIPLKPDAFVNLVVSQPDYKDRSGTLTDKERKALGA